MKQLRHAAGSLMVVGLESTALSGLERAWLKLIQPGGVILFRRNIESADQTRELLNEATSLCAVDSFRCVDVEGGTVDRLRDALGRMPSAQEAAQAGAGREHGRLIAQGVRAFGFNTTLAPVLDLGLPASSEVMGTRCAGATPDEVIDFARGFLAGLAQYGVTGCGKHFPGLGGGTLDSHRDTPKIERAWNQLCHQDLEPYRALFAELPMVMVNHAAYPKTLSGNRPASVSAFWMTTVLRKQLGYRGVIFSDDLEMGGILKFMPMNEAAVESIRAGMDTVEVCHSPEQILRAYEGLVHEAEKSSAFQKLLMGRARAMKRKRQTLFHRGVGPRLSSTQLAKLRAKILKFNEDVTKLSRAADKAAPIGERTLVETA
ncbi:MAG: beta-N-acetylhexosaminidase [Acidobacteriota bacterium]|nr:beta-N-acetylhexosaminidase [Acidobacteriota bacterium]